MTTTLLPCEQHFVLQDVDWEFYESLLSRLGDRPLFLTYDRGRLELMSPSEEHESFGRLVGRLIETLTLELDIPLYSVGSTTFRREDLDRGLEPDECCYIQNELKVRAVEEIDLTRDPPPDLVVEIEISRRLLDREGIYAALGVPELWRFDGERLRVYQLGPAGVYQLAERSVCLPMLPPAEVERFVGLRKTTDETTLVRSFRSWVRQTLGTKP
ncbi:MAG: Uma2 family endonuclease [Planctomycetes bacterium]|nr:Uma2 family endonuclease [Planctomycetota bacterium]